MRSKIYKKFKPILDKDKINLKQQIFLDKYVELNYDDIDRFLIYHGIGTGKTRTSIIIAEKIMKMYPIMKTVVILPARLKTNYIDELIPILFEKDKKRLKIYTDNETSETDKNKLRKYFYKKISINYSIYSYEYIVNMFKKSSNIDRTLKLLTKNKIIIIDEFHNLISNKIEEEIIYNLYKKNKLSNNVKNIRALIMRYISRYAHKTCKMFFLTATPIFDNYYQFIELVKILNIEPIKEEKVFAMINLIPYIKNKISYYEIENKSDFPEISYINDEIPLSKTQEKITYEIQNSGNDKSDFKNIEKETFLLKQRQISISVYNFDKVDKIFKNLDEYAPKLKVLFNYLNDKKNITGKHLIYSNFINYCLHIIKEYLDRNGWSDYNDKSKDNIPYKSYILWDASLNDNDKQNIKIVLNSKDNMDGKIIKVILGSPSIKEGISFKHIQHLHQIDPVWNSSAKEQIEGRCIRFKSHEDIPIDHKYLKRKVIIHNYISIPISNDKKLVTETCDQKIYMKIIPRKKELINKITNILKKIAIDYYLYKKLSDSPSTKSISNITIDEDDNIDINVNKIKDVKFERNRCPKPRRPINGKCKENYIMKLNKYNNECCYKKRK